MRPSIEGLVMAEKRVNQIKATLESKETDELISIWVQNDKENYDAEAFEAIKLILNERKVTLPSQSEPAPVDIAEEQTKEDNFSDIDFHAIEHFFDSLFPSISPRERGAYKIIAGVLIGLLSMGLGVLFMVISGGIKTPNSAAAYAGVLFFILGLASGAYLAITGSYEVLMGKSLSKWYEWWNKQSIVSKIVMYLIVVPLFILMFFICLKIFASFL